MEWGWAVVTKAAQPGKVAILRLDNRSGRRVRKRTRNTNRWTTTMVWGWVIKINARKRLERTNRRSRDPWVAIGNLKSLWESIIRVKTATQTRLPATCKKIIAPWTPTILISNAMVVKPPMGGWVWVAGTLVTTKAPIWIRVGKLSESLVETLFGKRIRELVARAKPVAPKKVARSFDFRIWSSKDHLSQSNLSLSRNQQKIVLTPPLYLYNFSIT